jgi:hypothetical protein
MHRVGRRAAAAGALATLTACSSVGSLGNVLGGVLGRGGENQVSGYVQGVETRSQVITLQASNGQALNILYDAQTKVVYNNQSYPVTSLDRGDQVTARIQSTNALCSPSSCTSTGCSAAGGSGSSPDAVAVHASQAHVRRTFRCGMMLS